MRSALRRESPAILALTAVVIAASLTLLDASPAMRSLPCVGSLAADFGASLGGVVLCVRAVGLSLGWRPASGRAGRSQAASAVAATTAANAAIERIRDGDKLSM